MNAVHDAPRCIFSVMQIGHSRRGFLAKSAAAAGAAMLGVSLPQFLSACKDAGESRTSAGFRSLSAEEAAEIDAIAACIVPTTDTPGAREAGALYFIDSMLGDGRPDLLEPIQAGLSELSARARSALPAADRFSDLDERTQIAILTQIQESDFFYTIRLLTLAGMLADPSYGGNRERLGWDLIGFEGKFAHDPPFGYYDADYSRTGARDDV